MADSDRVIEVPVRQENDDGTEQTVLLELDLEEQAPEDIISIFTDEKVNLSLWHKVAMYFYRKGDTEAFRNALEAVEKILDTVPEDSENHKEFKILILTMLAAYYLRCSNDNTKAPTEDEKSKFREQANVLHNRADREDMMNQSNLLGKSFIYISQGDWKSADRTITAQLTSPGGDTHIPTLLAKACVLFNKGKFAEALDIYRKVLIKNPACPAAVRVGIGMCFNRLKQFDKAKDAFERALELDADNTTALLGNAILELNAKTKEGVKTGMACLTKAYELDRTNPMVLNHLADHFFLKQRADEGTVLVLTQHALKNTKVPDLNAESYFHIARVFHRKNDYDNAFRNYYQASKLAPNFTLPYYGLGQMHLYREDKFKARECFERVLRDFPDNYETLKILGSLYGESEHPTNWAKGAKHLERVVKAKPDDYEAWLELAAVYERLNKNKAVHAYTEALRVYLEILPGVPVPPELLNNLGALHLQLGNVDDAGTYLARALDGCTPPGEDAEEDAYYIERAVSVRYNLALLQEQAHCTETSPRIFKVVRQNGGSNAGASLSADVGTLVELKNSSVRVAPGDVVDVLCAQQRCIQVVVREGPDGEGGFAPSPVTGSATARTARAEGTVLVDDLEEVSPAALDLYSDLLVEHPSYIDCHLRMTEIHRKSGNLQQALASGTQALQQDGANANIIATIGNIHMQKKEVNRAQRQFEKILSKVTVGATAAQDSSGSATKDDPYSVLSLANIWLAESQTPKAIANEELKNRCLRIAETNFRTVLLKDKNNAYAANGIGCIMALRGKLTEAKDVFVSVREAETGLMETWINLAHVYLLQKNYVNAIKLYENCLRRFYHGHNVDIMQYLARAYLRSKRCTDCHQMLIKALHLEPQNDLVRFNVAVAGFAVADSILRKADYTLSDVTHALALLRDSRLAFQYLASKKSGTVKFSVTDADKRARRCDEYIQQAKGHQKSAEKYEAEKQRERDAVELKRQEFLKSVAEREARKRETAQAEREARLSKLKQFETEITEQDLLTIEMKKKKEPSARKRKTKNPDDDLFTDVHANDAYAAEADGGPDAMEEDGDYGISDEGEHDNGGGSKSTKRRRTRHQSKTDSGKSKKRSKNVKEPEESEINSDGNVPSDDDVSGMPHTAEDTSTRKPNRLQRDDDSDDSDEDAPLAAAKSADAGDAAPVPPAPVAPAMSKKMIESDDEDSN